MSDDDTRPVPVSLFDHAVDSRVKSLEDSRHTWRWIVGLAAPAVIAVMLWAADRVASSATTAGETKATIEAFRRSLDTLDLDVRELRSKILKLSGTDPDPGLSIATEP
jgi:hypothetical protein